MFWKASKQTSFWTEDDIHLLALVFPCFYPDVKYDNPCKPSDRMIIILQSLSPKGISSTDTVYSPPSNAISLQTTSSVARDRFRFDLRFELLSFSRLGMLEATPSDEHIAAGLFCKDPNSTNFK
jgi:hypothetical protein